MLYFEIMRVALNSLRVNPLRSMLTMLGVIIGVAAVITTVSYTHLTLPTILLV